MRWNFHGLVVEGTCNDDTLRERWQTSFASRPAADGQPDIVYDLSLVDDVPPEPVGVPQFEQDNLLSYRLNGERLTAHFPRFGQLQMDLSRGRTRGVIVPEAVTTYGVLEDMLAIGLSPHLRRRGHFLIHAFAAALSGKGILLVGGIGAGKTTTGMSLLNDGWKLISNDSPIVTATAEVLSYPGVLAAYPETFARFPVTAHLADRESAAAGRPKVVVPAESIWPDVWSSGAPLAAIFFPQIAGAGAHELRPLKAVETLRTLMPHAIEKWDKAMMATHLGVLRALVDRAPGYLLRLGPDVSTIPAALAAVL